MIDALTAIILAMIAPCPNHPVLRHGQVDQLAEECVAAADRYDQDSVELITWAFHESSLRSTSTGALGEVGMMQVHGAAAAMCREAGETPGTLGCGAYLFRRGEEICGTHRRALWWFASGKCDGTPRAKRITAHRLRRARHWRGYGFKNEK